MYNKNKIASLLPRKLIYCDVGARWEIEGPWKQFRDIIELISFEPDREEYELLSEKKYLMIKFIHMLFGENLRTFP